MILMPKSIPIAKIRLNPGFLLYQIIGTTSPNVKTSIRHGEKTPSIKKVNGMTRATNSELETLSSPLLRTEFSIIAGKTYRKIALIKKVANPIIMKIGK